MFDNVNGSKAVRQKFFRNHRVADIKELWMKDVPAFRQTAKKDHLYR